MATSAKGEIRRRFAASSCAGSRIAFHFASLRCRLPESPVDGLDALSPLLSRAHGGKRNATRDPAQEAAAKRRNPSVVFRGALDSGGGNNLLSFAVPVLK